VKIAILIPSLNRPQRIRPTAEAIHENTTTDHRVYWCVSDPESVDILDELREDHIVDTADPDHRYVTRMNRLVAMVDEDFIFFGSDDVIHHPGWDREALRAFDDPKIQLVVVNDLRNQNGTQALIRREYLELATFDAPGKPFHHGYQHNFADTEQFLTAQVRGVHARAMGSYVEHLHPLFQKANSIPWDQTYATGAMANWDVDSALFNARAAMIVDALSSVA
jgi:glycosyltransferase involved in cell wall biosynthesis